MVYPLANLLATEQVHLGDLVRVDWDGEHDLLTFRSRGRRRAWLVMRTIKVEAAAAAAEVRDGKLPTRRQKCGGNQKIARRVACGDARGGATEP